MYFERKIIHMNIGGGARVTEIPRPLGVVTPSHSFVPPLLRTWIGNELEFQSNKSGNAYI